MTTMGATRSDGSENVAEVKEYKSERTSVSVTPGVLQGARDAAADLGMTQNAWLGMAIGRAVRAHRMEREVLEKVLKETFGEQLKMEMTAMERHDGTP